MFFFWELGGCFGCPSLPQKDKDRLPTIHFRRRSSVRFGEGMFSQERQSNNPIEEMDGS